MPAEARRGGAAAARVWSPAQRRLHWWTALLVAVAFPLGFVMVFTPASALLEKFLLYQTHKSIGIAVFVLVAARLALRAGRGRPAEDALIPAWQRGAATVGHAALYALLLAVPLLGYFTAATAPAAVPTLFLLVIPVPHAVGVNPAAYEVLWRVHRAAAILLVALACGHALAAVHHHLRGRDTLRAMWRGGPASG